MSESLDCLIRNEKEQLLVLAALRSFARAFSGAAELADRIERSIATQAERTRRGVASDGIISVSEMADSLGVGRTRVTALAKQLGIELQRLPHAPNGRGLPASARDRLAAAMVAARDTAGPGSNGSANGTVAADGTRDPLFEAAADLATQMRCIHKTHLRKTFNIGTERAGRLIVALADAGIIDHCPGTNGYAARLTYNEWRNLAGARHA